MQFVVPDTRAGALVLAVIAWSTLGGAVGIVAAWLSLHHLIEAQDPQRARPARWWKLGMLAGAALATAFWMREGASPQFTGVLLWVDFWIAGGALTSWFRDRHSEYLTPVARGILLGALASGAAYVAAEYPAEVLTVIGFAVWGWPLAAIMRVRPGRSELPTGSLAESTWSATVVLSATGVGVAMAGWSWPWLALTLPAAALAWFLLGLAIAGITRRHVGASAPHLIPATPHGRDNPGPVVAIMPGFGAESDEWTRVADLLAAGDARERCAVYRFEPPWGPGGQRPKLSEQVLPFTREAVNEALNRLAEEHPDREIFLLCHSFGGGFGLTLAADPHPKLTGILAVEPLGLEIGGNVRAFRIALFLKWLPGADRLSTLAIPRIQQGFEPEFRPFIETFRRFRFATVAVKLGPQTLGELLAAVPRAIETLPRARARAISVLFGAGDSIVAARSARRLTLAGIEHTEIEGGHDLHVANPEAVVEWADGAMERIRARRAES